jgi:hypothetical protein
VCQQGIRLGQRRRERFLRRCAIPLPQRNDAQLESAQAMAFEVIRI